MQDCNNIQSVEGVVCRGGAVGGVGRRREGFTVAVMIIIITIT